ncbi:MAG: tryptophan-rich sensory protein [Nitratireductor sp.]|nr:tryptophan-rich sensory protein [Nitratireductor sp.]MCC0020671.1 tryptophan-rich sensory protein [Nitratireductor sp.]
MLQRTMPYIVFILLMLVTGFAAGFATMQATAPGGWYGELAKPWFNPPSWVFAPVWTVLYILIGLAGGAVYRWDPQSRAVKWWFVQLVLNFAWSFLFFFFKLPLAALADIFLLLFAIIAFMRSTRGEVSLAVWCFWPYLLWVSFATLLNASIVALN